MVGLQLYYMAIKKCGKRYAFRIFETVKKVPDRRKRKIKAVETNL